jgi:hypothetical protein
MRPIDSLSPGLKKKLRFPKRWSWCAAVPSWSFALLAAQGYPGWDKIGHHPPYVICALTRGMQPESAEMAAAWDGEAEGLFHYRDQTTSGLPFVPEGGSYQACFWFQRLADAERFHERFGGEASWKRS